MITGIVSNKYTTKEVPMAYGNISAKQEEILEYLKEVILKKGYPPSVREICTAVGLSSTSSVFNHLEKLEKNGYIRRDPAKPRCIEIVDDSFQLTRREMAQIPVVGTVAAGQPILAQQNIKDYFPIPVEYAPNTESFILEVKGESMINAGIMNGDHIVRTRLSASAFLDNLVLQTAGGNLHALGILVIL